MKCMKERDTAYRRMARCNSPLNVLRYRTLRSEVSNGLDSAKNAYYKTRLNEAESQAAKWKILKGMGIGSTSKPSPLAHFSADELNAHYSKVGSNSTPLTDSHLREVLDIRPSLPDGTSPTPFRLAPVTAETVFKLLTGPQSSATGYDGLSIDMLRLTSPDTIPHIVSLFNKCIESSCFPSPWKKALLRPLAKITKMKELSDTRPIALLPVLSKLFERIVHDQLSHHLSSNNLLDDRQSGFRRGHSTQTAQLGVIDDVRRAIDKRMITFILFFDFSKAFDTVPHNRLLRKLRAINCSDSFITLIFSYLKDREQAVVDDNGNTTDWARVNAGVPQGSVLGPLLFAIYINDLPLVLRNSLHMIYADDTQIYLSVLPCDFNAGVERISRDGEAIANWAASNGLKLNVGKTKAMVMGSLAYISGFDLDALPKISIFGEPLPYETEVKTLGLILTPTLNWSKHVATVIRRANFSLRNLRLHSHSLSRSLRKELAESLVLSHLDYMCLLYHDTDKTRNRDLQVLQNACVRFVFGNIGPRDHVTPHRLSLGWLSVKRRREFFLGSLAFNVIANRNPLYLSSRFTRLNVDVIVRSSARLPPRSLTYAPIRTEAMKGSFLVGATDLINSIAPPSFEPSGHSRFKCSLYNLLLERDRLEWVDRAS